MAYQALGDLMMKHHVVGRSARLLVIGIGIGTVAVGCAGAIGDGSEEPEPNSIVPPIPDTSGILWPVDYSGSPSALRRLSRDELVASLQMLVGSAPARDDLPEEPRRGHSVLQTSGLSFIATEVSKLRQVLSAFATKVAPAMLGKTGCAQTQQAQRDCLLGWSTRFAEQAMRRSLRAGESTRLQSLLTSAGTSAEDDTATVEGILTTVFFTPSFLYRTEIGKPVAGKPGLRALEPRELASRLSFLATQAPPDAELLSAGTAGRLQDPAERVRQLDRLLKSDRGKRALVVLVLEWLGANESKVSDKSAKYLTTLGADFEPSIRASAEATIRKVVDENADPSVTTLLTTEAYLADAVVQKVRQAAGSGRTATGDTALTTRAGLMMHPYVLSAHTKEDGASPFPLGEFIRETLLCEAIPPPPAGAVDSARTDPPAGLTMREDLDYRTSAGPTCISCHKLFAPLGYAFLPFDPVGRWVKTDPTGKPWDLAGSVPIYAGTDLAFKSPSELTKGLASQPQVHGCFAQASIAWAFGRAPIAEDHPLVVALNDVVGRAGSGVGSVLRAIVATPGFLTAVGAR